MKRTPKQVKETKIQLGSLRRQFDELRAKREKEQNDRWTRIRLSK